MTSVVADFDAVDEMNADGPTRKGSRADAGLAVKKNGSVACGNRGMLEEITPRKAIEAANLVFESMIKVNNDRRAAKEKTKVR